MENGQERVEVEEDGQLKSVTINGEEGPSHQSLAGSPGPQSPLPNLLLSELPWAREARLAGSEMVIWGKGWGCIDSITEEVKFLALLVCNLVIWSLWPCSYM